MRIPNGRVFFHSLNYRNDINSENFFICFRLTDSQIVALKFPTEVPSRVVSSIYVTSLERIRN